MSYKFMSRCVIFLFPIAMAACAPGAGGSAALDVRAFSTPEQISARYSDLYKQLEATMREQGIITTAPGKAPYLAAVTGPYEREIWFVFPDGRIAHGDLPYLEIGEQDYVLHSSVAYENAEDIVIHDDGPVFTEQTDRKGIFVRSKSKPRKSMAVAHRLTIRGRKSAEFVSKTLSITGKIDKGRQNDYKLLHTLLVNTLPPKTLFMQQLDAIRKGVLDTGRVDVASSFSATGPKDVIIFAAGNTVEIVRANGSWTVSRPWGTGAWGEPSRPVSDYDIYKVSLENGPAVYFRFTEKDGILWSGYEVPDDMPPRGVSGRIVDITDETIRVKNQFDGFNLYAVFEMSHEMGRIRAIQKAKSY